MAAPCAVSMTPHCIDLRNAEQTMKFGNGPEFNWRRYIEQNGDEYPLIGSCDPASEYGPTTSSSDAVDPGEYEVLCGV